jgi:hypothetical protein
MKGKLLIVFVILLLGFILFSFLGGNKFYNVLKEGFSNDSQTFTAPDGSTAVISSDSNGKSIATVTPTTGSPLTYNETSTNEGALANSILYSGSNGSTAILMDASKTGGVTNFQTKDANGTQVMYTQNTTSSSSSSDTSSDSSPSSDSSTTPNSSNSNYDNYNHYNGSSYPSIFYGPNGGTARIVQTPTNNTIVITNKNGTTDIYYINNNTTKTVQSYYGPNGGSAKIITLQNGNKAIEITSPNGSKIIYYANNADAQSTSQDSTINQYSPDTNTTGSDYNNAFSNINPYSGSYNNPYINTNTITGPAGNTYSTYDSSAYMNSLPQGIPKSMIPPGQEDLYILKSQVVPPVCPKCPDPIVQCPDNNDVTKCPPCAPCSRCPEPSFSCKKVPNYNAFNQDYMPVPVLNSFSSFGM